MFTSKWLEEPHSIRTHMQTSGVKYWGLCAQFVIQNRSNLAEFCASSLPSWRTSNSCSKLHPNLFCFTCRSLTCGHHYLDDITCLSEVQESIYYLTRGSLAAIRQSSRPTRRTASKPLSIPSTNTAVTQFKRVRRHETHLRIKDSKEGHELKDTKDENKERDTIEKVSNRITNSESAVW